MTSYGGYLEFTLRYVPVPGADEQSDGDALVEIFVSLEHVMTIFRVKKCFFFQNCSKLPKNHFRQIIFFPDLGHLGGQTKSGKFQIFFLTEPFPNFNIDF